MGGGDLAPAVPPRTSPMERPMIRKALLTVALMAGVSSYALAQNSTSPSPTTPPGSSSSTMSNSANSGQLTEAQVKSKLQREGYSNISLKAPSSSARSTSGSGSSTAPPSSSSNQPMWTGTATKGGKQVNISVTHDGTVSEGLSSGAPPAGSTGSMGINR